MQQNNVIRLLSSIILISTSMTVMAEGTNIVNEKYHKAVGKVSWHNQVNINPTDIINKKVPNNLTNLIFIRRQDNDNKESNANVSINDRYQVSLQPNGYTQVYSCPGKNLLSVELTGIKTNDLLAKSESFDLRSGKTYFFYIDVDNNQSTSLVQITPDSAKAVLLNKMYQSHQVSRVLPTCATTQQPAPAPPTAPPTASPLLTKEINIAREVLFDTDKYLIKPQFEHKISEVADFMNKYQNTTGVIEGHTDSRASITYNQKLSHERAHAVASMLVNRFGVSSSRIQYKGYSETRPKAPNDTVDNLQKNRRAMVVVKGIVKVDEYGNQISK